jgi:hypothetical protein
MQYFKKVKAYLFLIYNLFNSYLILFYFVSSN